MVISYRFARKENDMQRWDDVQTYTQGKCQMCNRQKQLRAGTLDSGKQWQLCDDCHQRWEITESEQGNPEFIGATLREEVDARDGGTSYRTVRMMSTPATVPGLGD